MEGDNKDTAPACPSKFSNILHLLLDTERLSWKVTPYLVATAKERDLPPAITHLAP